MKRDIDALIESNQGIVGNIARKHFSSRLPDDDLMQCGLIGLWEAAQKWSGNDDFTPFARVCIYHNMLDYVRGLSAKKRTPCEELGEADEPTEDDYSGLDAAELCREFARVLMEDTLEYVVLSQIALNGDIRAVADILSMDVSEERKVAKRAYRAVIKAREAKGNKDKE